MKFSSHYCLDHPDEAADEIERLTLQRNTLDHALRQRDKQCLQLIALIRDVHGGLLDERIATALQVQPQESP
jgi:hypothetical protein